MLDVSNEEITKKLRQLTIVDRLEKSAIEYNEKRTMGEIYMDITTWLEKHGVKYCFDRDSRRYVKSER